MSVEKRLLDDAKSFADEVANFDDDELFADIMAKLGINMPGLAASPSPTSGSAVFHDRAGGPVARVGANPQQ